MGVWECCCFNTDFLLKWGCGFDWSFNSVSTAFQQLLIQQHFNTRGVLFQQHFNTQGPVDSTAFQLALDRPSTQDSGWLQVLL
jgi:hypothetical protein